MKLQLDWAEEMQEDPVPGTNHEPLRQHTSKAGKKKPKTKSDWVYSHEDYGKNLSPKKLYWRCSLKHVSVKKQLYLYIMEERYNLKEGELSVEDVVDANLIEATVVIEDYYAGRPVVGTARGRAVHRFAKLKEAAMKDKQARQG